MFAVSDALPHSLLASHLYSPASFLLIFGNTRMFPLVRLPPLTLIQDTFGKGIPDALQKTVTLPPSVSGAGFCIDWMDEGTVMKNRYTLKKIAK